MEIIATDRRGKIHRHAASDKLSDSEVLERFGLLDRPFSVDVHPSGRPDLTRRIQTFEARPEGSRVWQTPTPSREV